MTLGGVMTLVASGAMAAEMGQRYDSYRDMHEKTQYGSLFFNEGAIRHEQSQSLKRFVTITGDGELDNLPRQEGYCFVFNHYDPNKSSVSHTYQGKISKWFKDGRHTVQVVKSTYTPASQDWSSDLPDLCVDGITKVTKVAITFSSDDNSYFDWNISFAIK